MPYHNSTFGAAQDQQEPKKREHGEPPRPLAQAHGKGRRSTRTGEIDANDLQSHLATVMKATGLLPEPLSGLSAGPSSSLAVTPRKRHPHRHRHHQPIPPPTSSQTRNHHNRHATNTTNGRRPDGNGATAAAPPRNHNKPAANGEARPVFGCVGNSGGGCLRLGPTAAATTNGTQPPKQQQQQSGECSRKDKMAILIKDQQTAQAPRYTGCRNDKAKPPYSYASLIAQALLAAPQRRLTLSSIYAWIMDRYPYYRSENCGWQNSIRHNLSLNRCFVRIARDDHDYQQPPEEDGTDGQDGAKGAFWTIDEALMDDFEDGMFKRRKYGQGRAARRQSGEERRRRRRPDTHSMDMVTMAAINATPPHKKMTIDDELFKQQHQQQQQQQQSPMIGGMFAPSPGFSTILYNCLQPPRHQDRADYDNCFIMRHDDRKYTQQQQQHYVTHEDEDEWCGEGEAILDDPFCVANQTVATAAFTCPELAESKYVFPMPPTFSDFYH